MIWLVYPGAMAIFASAAGLAYVVAALGALRDKRLAIWISLAFSVVTAILSALGVSRFLRNGFDFSIGNFDQQSGIYFPPYMLLAMSIVATLIVALHLVAWRWVLRGEKGLSI